MTTPVTASIAPSPTISARVKSISPTTKIASDTTAIEAPTVSSDSKMMSPDMMPYMPIEYVYSYTGSLGTIPKEMNVFRKKIESISSTPASDILQKFNLTSLDIARFQSLKIQNMSLVEDREYGLALNVDFTQ